MLDFVFTSESVGLGHPDKFCDYLSDSLYWEHNLINNDVKTGIEIMCSNNTVYICGETSLILSKQKIKNIIKKKIRKIYKEDNLLNLQKIKIVNNLSKQSKEISKLVNNENIINAGDQGIVFGYAINIKEANYMPLPITIARELLYNVFVPNKKIKNIQLLSDSKSQISIKCSENNKYEITTIVLALQYKDLTIKKNNWISLKKYISEIIFKYIKEKYKNIVKINLNKCHFFITFFKKGGFNADTGLTGRKNIVDTYGGWCSNGGGALSGKDYTKIDRSAAYYARYVAKNVVVHKKINECEIQIAYAIGYPKQIEWYVDFKNSKISDKKKKEIILWIKIYFDFSILNMEKELNLKNIDYSNCSEFGSHFGNNDYNWEKIKKNTNKIINLLYIKLLKKF